MKNDKKPGRFPLPGFLRKMPRSTFQILLVVVVLLVALRVALPFLVQWYVNKTLDEMPDYDGRIGEVDIKLWRGAYEIEDIEIVKTTGKVPEPFFSCKRMELSVEWKALFQGAFVGEIFFQSPIITFVQGPTEATTQVGVDKPWLEVIDKLFPLDINRFEVAQGIVRYRDFHSTPKVNLEIDRIEMLATNLTNSLKLSKTLVAKIDISGRVFKESGLKSQIRFDPGTHDPTFDVDLKVNPFPLVQLNDFTKAYAGFDFERGTMELAMELAANEGNLKGYVKPLLDNAAILNLRKDASNPLALVWESLVGGLSRIFRNQPHNRFATKIPIEGTFKDPKVGIWPTIGNVFKNGFIRVFQGDLENTIGLEDAAKEKPPKPKESSESASSKRPGSSHPAR